MRYVARAVAAANADLASPERGRAGLLPEPGLLAERAEGAR
jgi:hypothetical protein